MKELEAQQFAHALGLTVDIVKADPLAETAYEIVRNRCTRLNQSMRGHQYAVMAAVTYDILKAVAATCDTKKEPPKESETNATRPAKGSRK